MPLEEDAFQLMALEEALEWGIQTERFSSIHTLKVAEYLKGQSKVAGVTKATLAPAHLLGESCSHQPPGDHLCSTSSPTLESAGLKC